MAGEQVGQGGQRDRQGVGGGWFIKGWGSEDRGLVLSYSYFSFFLFSHVLCCFFKWLEHDSCCFSFLFSLSLVASSRRYWCLEIVVSVMENYSWSQYLITALWISLEKGECFNLNHSLQCLPYFVHHH